MSPRKKIWLGNKITSTRTGTQLASIVTLEQWNFIEELLKQGVSSPIYINYYFDALEYFDLMDFQRCVINLAISCEVVMKNFVEKQHPIGQPDSIKEHIERTNINVYYDKFLPDLLEEGKKEKFLKLQADLRSLFRERNFIVHRGSSPSLSPEQCQRYIIATRNLIDLF